MAASWQPAISQPAGGGGGMRRISQHQHQSASALRRLAIAAAALGSWLSWRLAAAINMAKISQPSRRKQQLASAGSGNNLGGKPWRKQLAAISWRKA